MQLFSLEPLFKQLKFSTHLSLKIFLPGDLRVSLPKTGPLRFGSENQFPLNFAHEYILVQK